MKRKSLHTSKEMVGVVVASIEGQGERSSTRLREKNPSYSKRGAVVGSIANKEQEDASYSSRTKDKENQEKDTKKPDGNSLVATRHSKRDIQKIRLKGTATTFYRRLNDLFFSQNRYKIVSSKLARKSQNPNIYVLDDFLTKNELEYFDYVIQQCPFERSFVDNMDYDNDQAGNGGKRQKRTIVDSHRTSSFYGFRKLHDSRIAALEQKVTELMGCWNHQIEALQLVRYRPGQFFGIHHDLGDLRDDDSVILPKKNLAVKRRVATIFCYLNSLGEGAGGCTFFPKAGRGDEDGLRVAPKRGRAVLWSNILSNGMPDPLTIHAGEPVSPDSDEVKYGLNIWICEE